MDATVQDARVEDQGTDGLAEGVAVLPPPQTGALRPEAAEPPRAKRADLTPSLLMSGEDVEAVEVRGEVSRCVLDPVGGRRARVEYRSRLVEVVEAGGRWCMVTLTVDRSVFSSPEVAYRKVAPCIPDLMRALFGDGAVWARVLEFQEASGEGWPHWHAVVKLPAGMTVNAARRRLWEVWRDRWQFARGGLDLTPVRSRRAAARYLGKYFFKGCTAPPWVLDRDRAPRMFGASVAAGEVAPPWRRARRSRSRRLVLGAERARRSKGKRRTVREALARSGSTVALVARVKDAATGKARVRVLARGIACPFRDAAFAAARGGWGAPAAREGAFVVSRPRGAQAFTVRAVQRLLQAVGGDRVEPYVLESRCAVDARWEERRPSRHRNGQAEGDRG